MTKGSNLTGSIGRNTVFGVLAGVVQVATRLVSVPIVIAHLGLGGFGIWSIITAITAYMRFGSIGIRAAFQKYVAEATGNGSYDRASKLLSTGTVAMIALSAAVLVPVCFLSKSLARASGVPNEFLQSAAWAISAFALIMIFANAAVGFESTIMGGHRIDLTRKLSTVTCVLEAAGIIAVLHFGYGLFAMAIVMAVSEIVYGTYCYFTAREVVPDIHISVSNVSRDVIVELVRFAGSYQLLSVLQMTYNAVIPIAILRTSGADPAGVLAVANRLVSPILMCQYAFLLPLLSGGAMVYASGSNERLRVLVAKSFKVTLGLTLLPLSLVCAFGARVVFAWTGQDDPLFRTTLLLVSLTTLFQCFALVGLVFYRSSGKALMDNIRELLRIAVVIPVLIFARELGYVRVLVGVCGAELIGMLFMLFTLTRSLHVVDTRRVLSDTARFAAATTGIVAAGLLMSRIFLPALSNARTQVLVQLLVICVAMLLVTLPTFYATGALSKIEVQSVLNTLKQRAKS